MRRLTSIAVVGMVPLGAILLAAPLLRTFEQDTLNQPPPGFIFAAIGDASGRWQVRGDRAARFLAYAPESLRQTGQATALLSDEVGGRFRASVRFRFEDGVRAAGMVWRYQDPENFYQATLDLTRQEVALHRVVKGARIKLEDEDDLELDPAAWHVMTVRQDDERVRIYLGGIGVVRSRTPDAGRAGRVGVWAAASAGTWFDDLRVDDSQEDRR
jgi:hypothetical protein